MTQEMAILLVATTQFLDWLLQCGKESVHLLAKYIHPAGICIPSFLSFCLCRLIVMRTRPA